MDNKERHFMIHSESLRLYSKVAFISECPNRIGKNVGKNNAAIGDPAAGLRIILSEIAQGLLQLNKWNAEIAENSGANIAPDVSKTE